MNQVRDLLYLLLGYLSGCVLYAEVFSRVFHKEIASAAKDKNPGAANAFVHGGFWCGVLTLAGDMLKGMVPVALYMHYLPETLLTPLAPLVLCAPVAGHVFPATTFGCLLGLLPFWTPVLVLACIFIFYSTILRITPNLSRTRVTYFTLPLGMLLMEVPLWICFGTLCMTGMVLVRLHISTEEREKPAVHLLWWT